MGRTLSHLSVGLLIAHGAAFAHAGEPPPPKTFGDPAFGYFQGEVVTVWIDDRKMRLKEEFLYVDQFGTRWPAGKGRIIDGSSIPRHLWTIVGSPYVGEHRYASILHDVACDDMKRPWQDVHKMYYHACRCAGVDAKKAKMMYAGIYIWPWNKWKPVNPKGGGGAFMKDPPPYEAFAVGVPDTKADDKWAFRVLTGDDQKRLLDQVAKENVPLEKEFLEIAEKIQKEDISLEEVEKLCERAIESGPGNGR